MTAAKSLRALLIGLVFASALAAATPASALIPAKTAWAPIALTGPTNLPPEDEGTIAVYAQNVGGIESTGSIVVTDELPPGLLTTGTPTSNGGGWDCTPGAGNSTVSCETTVAVGPGLAATPILIPVATGPSTLTPATNLVTVEGGGAIAPATYEEPVTISSTPAKPGAQAFTAGSYDPDGTLAFRAGSHPYAGVSAVFVNTVLAPNGDVMPAGDPKTIEAELPPGFIGNPTATPRCPEGLSDEQCPIDTQVGLIQPITNGFGANTQASAVHAVEAPFGYPAKFTFTIANSLQVNVLATLRSDRDYGITVGSPGTPQIQPVYGVFVSLWGAPADPSHDDQRCVNPPTSVECGPSDVEDNTAFLALPTDCALQAEVAPIATLSFDTWLTPGQFERTDFPIPPVTGCEALHLDADLAFEPAQKAAATPSATTTTLTIPQEGLTDPEELITPELRTSRVTLPAGVLLNPSSADGLQTCSAKEIGFREYGPLPNRIRFTKASPQCPDASKIGTVEVLTPLLDNPLNGALYLAAQNDNPFHSLLALYLVVDDPATGITLKLPGEVKPNPDTGQLTALFDDNPQLPFSQLILKTKGGDRAPLATPDTCGIATTNAQLTPWSAPESGADTFTSGSFELTSGPNGGPCAASKSQRPFAPTFAAGTQGTNAGAYSPLQVKVTRKDGEQELRGIQFTLPRGLTGKLAGIATCSEAALTSAEHKSGTAERQSPSCPKASEVASVSSVAGIGKAPITVTGKSYLTAPYKGAPLSITTIIPALAGPFDLGNVLVKAAAYVDPESAELSAKTDQIPALLKGIPVALRQIEVSVDKANFIINPTSCEAKAINARLIGAEKDASASARFQVGRCEALPFKPRLSAKLIGGTKRNDHPAFSSTLTFPQGTNANVAAAAVTLPHSEFLDQAHIRTVCTRVQFAAKACPQGAVYGHATATTPLLDQPLTGQVYLRSSSNKLPDLVAVLKGPDSLPIEIDLIGRVDSIHGGIRTSFDAVPDAPVSKFTITLQGGKKGLLVNSRNLCGKAGGGKMTVRLIGQNGKRADSFPRLGNSCGKARKGKGHRGKSHGSKGKGQKR